jgi:rhodanese-related sulfurtransferase
VTLSAAGFRPMDAPGRAALHVYNRRRVSCTAPPAPFAADGGPPRASVEAGYRQQAASRPRRTRNPEILMAQAIEFVGNHLLLVGGFVMLLVLFAANEMRRGGRSISPQQLVHMVNRENAVVLDVRDRKEFQAGHIVDSVNIPFAALGGRLSELERYRQQPIIVACKIGQHSGAAGTQLRKAGFENVQRLAGGIAEWRNASLPVVKGNG